MKISDPSNELNTLNTNNNVNKYPVLKLMLKKMSGELNDETPLKSLYNILCIVAGLMNIAILVFVAHLLGEEIMTDPVTIFAVVSVLLLVSIVADFVPSQKSIVLYLVPYHPLSRKNRFLLWLLANELNVFNYLLALAGLTVLLLPFLSWEFKVIVISGGIIARLLSFFMRVTASYAYSSSGKWHLYVPYLLAAVPFLTLLGTVRAGIDLTVAAYAFVASSCGLLYLQFIVLDAAPDSLYVKDKKIFKANTAVTGSGRLPKKLLATTLFALLLKMTFIVLNFLVLNKKGEYLFGVELVFLLYVSPITLFSFALNNYYAFDPHYFFNIYFRTGRKGPLINAYLRTVGLLLVTDFTVMASAFYAFQQLPKLTELLPFYIATSLVLIILGMFFSTVLLLKIDTKSLMTSYKTYTHPASSLLCIILVFGLSYFVADIIYLTVSTIVLLLIAALMTYRVIIYKTNNIIKLIDHE